MDGVVSIPAVYVLSHGWPPDEGSAPVDSPLKVWDGTAWVSTGVTVGT